MRLVFVVVAAFFCAQIFIALTAHVELPNAPALHEAAVPVRPLPRNVMNTTASPDEVRPCSVSLVGVVEGPNTAYVISRDKPVQVVAIERGRVTFRKEGHLEVCSIWDRKDTPASPAYVIAPSKVAWAQQHLAQLMTEARVVPAFRDDKVYGFKVFSIRPGSLYQELGLQNGDVIEAINGTELTSADRALALYATLPDLTDLHLQIERAGSVRTLTYAIR